MKKKEQVQDPRLRGGSDLEVKGPQAPGCELQSA